MSTSRTLTLTTLAATFALASPALAVDRYAEPGGDGAAPCAQADPCAITTAFGTAVAGDAIKLLPGTHTVVADIDVLDAGLTVEPATPGTRPVVASTSNSEPVFSVQHAGTEPVVMRGLEIVAQSVMSDVNHEALVASSPLELSDTVLRARARVLHTFGADRVVINDVTIDQLTGIQPAAQLDADSGIARNLTVDPSDDSAGVQVSGDGSSLTDTTVSGGVQGITVGPGATARRITGVGVEGGIRVFGGATLTDAVARATGFGTAMTVQGAGQAHLRNVTAVGSGPGANGLQVAGGTTIARARNLILRGVANDVLVSGGATVELDHSNFREVSGPFADSGQNQTSDPLFVNAAAGDYRLQAGSPAIDRGLVDDITGSTDRDGASRFQGAAPDLGAFERTAPPAVTPDPRPEPQPTATPAPPAADTLAPTVSKLTASALRGRAATLRFSVSESGSVLLTLKKATAGKRKGNSCVKPTKTLRKAKPCRRFVTLASTRKTVASPTAKLTVGKKLAAGTYRVTVTPKDQAGNTGKAVTKTFVVKRRR